VYNDDTTVKILERMGRRAQEPAASEIATKNASERKGLFTSGSYRAGSQAGPRPPDGLFFTGPRHAGENLAEVLSRRAADLDAPIQMCDALSRNVPAELKTILAHCLAHGRRRFVDVADRFPKSAGMCWRPSP